MVNKLKVRRIFSAGLWALFAACSFELLPTGLTRQLFAAEPIADGLPALSPDDIALESTSGRMPAQADLNETYRLGAGDSVSINIFNVPEYSGDQKVLADGSLNLPVVGRVSVNGLTLQSAGEVIGAAYQGELRYPQITVVLNEPRPLRVAIAGEVGQPGLYTLTPENDAQFPTVAQALQTAGGVTQAADLRRVQLRRAGSSGAQTVTLDLWELLNNGDVRQDIALRDGDAIVISETNAVNIAETNRLAASNLAASVEQDMVVAIIGEVFRPGAYEFTAKNAQNSGRTTVTQVVKTAGGIKPSANIRNIQVRRQTRSGAEQLIDIDFWRLLQEGDISQDLVLQQGDTVIIPTATDTTPAEIAQLTAANFSPDKVTVNVVGEVERPGVISTSPDTTLNQAVLAAGGFTQRATETVELIRLNPNGSVTQREVEVDLTTGIDPEKNPLILNNDVVVVGRNGRAQFNDSLGSVLSPLIQLASPLNLLFRLF